ncbi:LuxR C-terminal-related transcriptional regulator [Hahella ganghwensis]|uniref:LuxR C-terminal-related transcriptional regulator n=1 Tax=Hahella ganghwensis TaxID=286420 RepID=UPI000362A36B|nr:LuxR C-terminal-related transcriptional regulator [Hahella ganghwensis]
MDKELFFKGKLSVPLSSPVVVSRNRLNHLLDKSRDFQFHCLTAPAGFGKTTLMLDWTGKEQMSSVWFTVEQSDNRPFRFWNGLLMAFANAGYHDPSNKEPGAYHIEDSGSEPWLSQFVNVVEEFDSRSESLNLILDDLHFLEDAEVLTSLARVFRFLLANIHLYLISRERLPNQLLASMPLDGCLHLEADELAFSLEEARDYVKLMQSNGSLIKYSSPGVLGVNSHITGIWQQVEGWPIFFCAMVHRSLHQRFNCFQMEAAFSITEYTDYIEGQILQSLSPCVLDILRPLATVSRFSPELVSLCLFPGQSSSSLYKLAHQTGLIIRESGSLCEYRIRQPLRDYLKIRDDWQKTDVGQTSFEKAFRWFLSHNCGYEAVTLCVENSYWLSAVHLIEKLYDTIAETGYWDEIGQWFEKIPGHIVAQRPLLLMLLGLKALYENIPGTAISYLNQAHDLLSSGARVDHPDNIYDDIKKAGLLQEISALIDSTKALYSLGLSYSPRLAPLLDAECGSELTSGKHLSSHHGSILVAYQVGLKMLYGNQFNEAKLYFNQVVEEALPDYPGILLQAIVSLGWTHYLTGEVEAWNTRLISLHDRILATGKVNLLSAWLNYTAVFGHLENGSTTQASQCLKDALVLQGECIPVDMRFNLLVAQIKLAIRNEEWDVAGEVVTEAEVLMQKVPLATQKVLYSLPALKAALLLAKSRREEALHLLQTWGGKYDEDCFASQHEALVRSDILLALDRPQEGLECATKVKEWSENNRVTLLLVRSLVSQSLAFQKMNREDKALHVFHDALYVGRLNGSVHSLTKRDVPEMKQLLKAAKNKGRYPAYINRLTDHCGGEIVLDSDESVNLSTLSKREKQVLDLLVTGMSNPEIANTLCRSLGTVKIHVHNIYRKLGAANRVAAINKYIGATV